MIGSLKHITCFFLRLTSDYYCGWASEILLTTNRMVESQTKYSGTLTNHLSTDAGSRRHPPYVHRMSFSGCQCCSSPFATSWMGQRPQPQRYANTYFETDVYIYICIYMYVCVCCVDTYIYIYIYMYIYVHYLYICIYIYIYILCFGFPRIYIYIYKCMHIVYV